MIEPPHFPVCLKQSPHKLDEGNLLGLFLVHALQARVIGDELLHLVVVSLEMSDGVAQPVVGTAIKRREPRVVDVVEFLAEGYIGKFVQVFFWRIVFSRFLPSPMPGLNASWFPRFNRLLIPATENILARR